MEFVKKLKSWLESLDLNQYSDEYNNWCFGNEKQKHIVHLHPYNTYADIEVNDNKKFNEFLEKYNIMPHEWHQDKWLIVDLVDEKSYETAKEIISYIIKNGPGGI